MAQIWIPALLRDLTGGQPVVDASGATVRQVIEALEMRYPGLQARLCEGERLRPAIALAVDGEISALGLRQPVQAESEIHFLPAVSGGRCSSPSPLGRG